MKTLGHKAISGIAWTSLEQGGVQILNLGVGIVLARLLMPADYGLMGMVAVFVAVARALTDFGLVQSLIQRPRLADTDISTAYWLNMALGAFLYAGFYLGAPMIANFYREAQLVDLTRTVALVIPIHAMGLTSSAILSRNLQFRRLMIVRVSSALTAAVLGLAMAVTGWGVWSLVGQTVIGALCATVLLRGMEATRIRAAFSRTAFCELTSFGAPLLLAGLIYRIGDQAAALLIGRRYAAGDLGFFTKAKRLSAMPEGLLYGIVYKVMYPTFCKMQDDRPRLIYHYRRTMRLLAATTSAGMLLLASLAPILVPWLLTDRWTTSVPILQRLCWAAAFVPIVNLNLNLMKVIGYPGRVTRLEALRQVCTLVALAIALPLGVQAMALALAVSAVASFFLIVGLNVELTGYALREQLRDVLPGWLVPACATGLVRAFSLLVVIPHGVLGIAMTIIAWCLAFSVIMAAWRPRVLGDLCVVLNMRRQPAGKRRS